MTHSQRFDPIWTGTMPEIPSFPPLEEDVTTDVCVVGAGISGLSVAHSLARAGMRVVVLDREGIGAGETHHTTAHLSNAFDDRYATMEREHGEDGIRAIASSHTAAIDHIESVIREEGIDCDFHRLDGYLSLAPTDERDLLERELEAARRAGLNDVELVESTPLASMTSRPALRFPRQGRFHPMRYLVGLAHAIERDGGVIHGGTKVTNVAGGNSPHVETESGRFVTARHIVVATNSPINDRFTIHTKQAPYTTYALGLQVPDEAYPDILLWDTLDPYHYLRIQETSASRGGYRILIVGGEDHRPGDGDPQERLHTLELWSREMIPQLGEIEFRWSGMVMEPVDGVAFIGRNPGDDNIYIVTGDSGMGMTHGTIAGILIPDLIAGRDNPWSSLYDPSRITPEAAKSFLREGADTIKHFVADWLGGGDVEGLEQIKGGSGAVVADGLRKLAVYRDANGAYHACSAVCTHLGCIVQWNDFEKEWNCPCHGSRFDPYGKVINGPATRDLEEANVESGERR